MRGSTPFVTRMFPAANTMLFSWMGRRRIFGRAQFPTIDALTHLKSGGPSGTTILIDRRLPTISYYSMWLDKDVYCDPVLRVGVIKDVYARDVRSRPNSYGFRRVIMANALEVLNAW